MTARVGGLVVLTLACMAGAEAPVGAQPGHCGWTVSLVAGSLLGGDLETGEREPTYGGAVGLGVGHGVSVEAEVAVIPELPQFDDLELLLGTGSLLYHPFTAGRFTPYGLLGASLARLRGRAGAETEFELAVDFGGGTWVRVAGRFALRADVRFIHIDNAPNFWRAVAGITVAP